MEFRKVWGFPYYSISRSGEVRGPKGNLMNLTKHPRGYYQVQLRQGRKAYHKLVHRLVLEAWDKPCPEGCVTHHINGNKRDNRLENLEWVTQKTNIWYRKDRIPAKKCPVCQHEFKPKTRSQKTCSHECVAKLLTGENHPRVKLKEEDIKNIRSLRKQGTKGIEVAKLYSITPSTVCDIVKRRCWKHVY